MSDSIVTPQMFGAVADYWLADGSMNPSPTDDTLAIQAALDASLHVYFPKNNGLTGYYTGSLKPRPGHCLSGDYSAGSTDTNTNGVYLVGRLGAAEIIDTMSNNAEFMTIRGLGLYGVNRAINGVNWCGNRSTFRDMHVLYCNHGFGDGADTSGSGVSWLNVTAVANNYGASNPNDGRFIGGRFASNILDGIICQEGANDNLVLGTKLDFNGRWGFNGYNAPKQTIIVENVDRNGTGGIRLHGCSYSRVIAFCQRNGSQGSSNPEENCHVLIDDASHVSIDLTTKMGAGDDENSPGPVTPLSSVVYSGTVTNLMLQGDLTGCTATPLIGTSGASLVDPIVLAAGTQTIVPGVRPEAATTATLATNESDTLVFDMPPLANNDHKPRVLLVSTKPSSSGTTVFAAQVNFAIVKAAGSVTVAASEAVGECGAPGAIGASGSPSVTLLDLSVSPDGTTLSIEVTNRSASSAKTRVYLTVAP